MKRLKRKTSTKSLKNSESHSDRSHVPLYCKSSQEQGRGRVDSCRNSPKRKAPFKNLETIIMVCTEGENTEPEYLKVFKKIHVEPSIQQSDFKLEVIHGDTTPMTVVDCAIQKLGDLERTLDENHSVWAMFDRDIHPYFDEAKRKAREQGVRLAVSNPCFELWGIYHYQDWHRPGDHLTYHHECQRKLRELCESYKESKKKKLFVDKDIIENEYRNAVDRAERSLRSREEEGDPEGGPSTSMHRLTEEILAKIKEI